MTTPPSPGGFPLMMLLSLWSLNSTLKTCPSWSFELSGAMPREMHGDTLKETPLPSLLLPGSHGCISELRFSSWKPTQTPLSSQVIFHLCSFSQTHSLLSSLLASQSKLPIFRRRIAHNCHKDGKHTLMDKENITVASSIAGDELRREGRARL